MGERGRTYVRSSHDASAVKIVVVYGPLPSVDLGVVFL